MEKPETAPAQNPQARSVRRRGALCFVAAAVAIGVFIGTRLLLENPDLPARVPIALVPVPFFVLFLALFIRTVGDMDELDRRIQLEALAFAYPAALVLLMTLGLLQLAGVALSPADWGFRLVWQIGVLLYVAGMAIASQRYK